MPEYVAMWESKYDEFSLKEITIADHIQSMTKSQKENTMRQLYAYDSTGDVTAAKNYMTGLNEKLSKNEIYAHKDSIKKFHEKAFWKVFAEKY